MDGRIYRLWTATDHAGRLTVGYFATRPNAEDYAKRYVENSKGASQQWGLEEIWLLDFSLDLKDFKADD